MDRFLQAAIEQRRDPGKHPRPHRIEISLHQIGDQHHQGQTEQGREVTARNHPIVYLQHIKGTRQHQDVDDTAEDGNPDHAARTRAHRIRDGIIGGQRRQQAGNCAGRRCCPRSALCLTLSDTH
jgi:hypothetical protein